MACSAMSILNMPLVQSYHPTTFLERGVVVPFTTPLLGGARARPGERGGPELLVPSPSGGRGVYILAWSGVRELCRPTVHDSRLNHKVNALASVTPHSIRKAAREVAAEGLAGRDALEAAKTGWDTEREETLLTNFLLLLTLVEQMEPAEGHALGTGSEEKEILEARAKRAIARMAPRVGRPPEIIASMLEDMAPVFAAIGVGRQTAHARCARALDALRRLHAEAMAWSQMHRDESGAQAEMIARVAELTISCTETTLDEAHGLTADMAGMLSRWGTEATSIRKLTARPEWLLDGWEQVCLLWGSSENDAARRAVLAEMALLVPIIPREASDWVGMPIDMDGAMRFRRTVTLNEDWRTGSAVFDLIARNEHLRALAA